MVAGISFDPDEGWFTLVTYARKQSPTATDRELHEPLVKERMKEKGTRSYYRIGGKSGGKYSYPIEVSERGSQASVYYLPLLQG